MRRLGAVGFLGLGAAILVLIGCPPSVPALCSGAECVASEEAGPPSRVVGLALGYHNCALLSNGQVKCWDVRDNQVRSRVIEGLDDAIQLSSGVGMCALRRDGRVACWGSGSSGLLGDGQEHGADFVAAAPVPVSGLIDAVQIKVGFDLVCALRRGGTVACWGVIATEAGNEIPAPTLAPKPVDGVSNAIQIAVGGSHACALGADGAVTCWGANEAGQTGESADGRYHARTPSPTIVPGVTDAVEVVAGLQHTCARSSRGSIQCWGRATYSGVDETGIVQRGVFSPVPQLVADLTDVVELGAGSQVTCARKRDGTVFCWGRNTAGQLGAGAPQSIVGTSTPIQVQGISNAVALGVSVLGSACVATGDGQVACWGSNMTNALGGGDSFARVPVRVQGFYTASHVAVGKYFSCASGVDDGKVACWGSNGYGALGAGIPDADPYAAYGIRAAAVSWADIPNAVALTAVDNHACARSWDGTVVGCWGSKHGGIFGDGVADPTMAITPQILPHLSGVKDLSVGRSIACARDAVGAVKSWGFTFNGVTGTPETVAKLNAVQLSSGADFACALRERPGEVACWGVNFDGQLGDGSQAASPKTPVTVLNIGDAIHIGAGYAHACAVRKGGQVMCWGANDSGQLGIGQHDYASHPVPVTVMNLEDAIEVQAGQNGTCVRRRNGQLVCWGTAFLAGNPDGADQATLDAPGAPVAGLVAREFAVGAYHACALGDDSRVVCWGDDSRGQLGDGRLIYSSSPVIVPVEP